ncbi:MAG: FG-GAP-like repeat-containing protein [Chloroflexota bacterium]|nr:FG-GAP-like repeat-containing protein [Chloroflexota bacterium]
MYQSIDLHGEGIPGILTEQAGAWFYKRNLSPINVKPDNGAPQVEAKFACVELVAVQPNLAVADGQAQFIDLAGDGKLDLVVMDGPMPGLYEHDGDQGWQPFRPFTARLNRDTRDPNLKFVDLDGNGRADVLITEDDAFVWHASLAEEGFGPARRVPQALDEEKGPRLVFADGTESIYLADCSGDGLSDLVRIRNGAICYWPNLGYGRFGAKVSMDHAPHFDNPDQFDYERIRLADIDGTGTTDIIYLHRDGVRLYFNQSGNSWSEPEVLSVFPRVDDLASIVPTDLLGNGTACLVWSSPLPGDAGRPMCYVNLMGRQKPHLLVKTVNNLGAETSVHYAPSTTFYLADKAAGKPWITRLPFPVHVVERVETYDRISRNRFVSRYKYHHGYFDGEEREFRGFGMVEQWDTEEFAALAEGGTLAEAANLDAASHVPPVRTKTWFHTGVYLDREHISRQFEDEYYHEQGLSDPDLRALLLPDTTLPTGLTLEEEREACRALKGMMLRQEVYADDAPPGSSTALIQRARTPYTVVEQSFTIRTLQPRAGNRHAVFFTHPREAITYHYERRLVPILNGQIVDEAIAAADPNAEWRPDPRTQHALTLEVDDFGNVLKEIAIGYGRRQSDAALPLQVDRDKQTQTLITYTENRVAKDPVTHVIDTANDYRTPLPCETRTYELTGFKPENNATRFSFDEWTRDNFALPASAAEIPYEQTADHVSKQKRLLMHVRTLYRTDDLTALLPLGELQPLALPGESYKLALTPGLLAQGFQRNGQPLLPNPANVLGGEGADRGGYLSSQTLRSQNLFPANNGDPLWTRSDADDHWWTPAGRVFLSPDSAHTTAQELAYAQDHFFLPHRYRDPFHTNAVSTESVVAYDAYDLLMVETRDALDNVVTAATRDDTNARAIRIDYRVLQPYWITDPNGNRSAVSFDVLGMVVATAVMGKPGEKLGDLLGDFEAEPALTDLQAFIADPQAQAASLLGKATTRIVYDLERYHRSDQPPFAATLARETHFHDPGGALPRIQISFSYSDGFGREIQKKIQAEAGDAPQRQVHVPLPGGDIRPGDLVRDAQGKPVPANTPRRWVGSGRTVFNNKGKPVRQYEPFFSATHLYEPEREMTDTGVSPVLFYDPVERVVATLHPNHTFEKVVFDPWKQTTYDVNDTVAANGTQTGDPRTDSDIAGYVREYFKTLPATWQTWHAQRIGSQLGAAERDAAQKAAAHANTPTVAHLDTLGRPFLTIAHNRYEQNGTAVEERYATRVELDIEGNQREVIDAKDRVVMRYAYDMLGNRIHQSSMEAGERWLLNDVAGKLIRAWDSRRFLRRMTYDELRRPTDLYVTENGAERLAERTVYGESQGDADNHRTRVYQVFDGAGIVTSMAYDFKGNLREDRRELLPTYKQAVDWLQNPVANDGTFTNRTSFDALNRPLATASPDGSVYRPTFNEANLLDKVDVNLRGKQENGQPKWTPFVTNINYNAKGQRELIAYGNGARITYDYDPSTFRLIHLKTTRPAGLNGLASQIFADPSVVQDLRYTYDPVGNITRIEDSSLQPVFHNNQQVDLVGSYTYDAIYRLIEAKGREHIGQTAFDFNPPSGNWRDNPFAGLADFIAHPNDLQALRNYTERYDYDAVGNFERLRHLTNGGGWTRSYEYSAASLIEPAKPSNRLTRTTLGNGLNFSEMYTYTDRQGNDVHGCMTGINTMEMQWDFEDQLHQVDLGGGGTAYYVYDATGQRVRKVIESQNSVRRKERVYLGVFEIYRQYNGAGTAVVLERESLHVLDDKQRIALVETETIQNGNPVNGPVPLQRYQFSNHLGSASVELAGDGALISYEEYHPYGTTAFQAGRTAAEVSLKRYRYSGKERDEESGLYYHRARYYAAWLARWTSCDPDKRMEGKNAYSYANTSPVIFVDSDGRFPMIWNETHETITKQAMNKAIANTKQIEAVKEFKRGLIEGVKHSDVPEGLWKLKTVTDAVEKGSSKIDEKSLTFRSHFGDLQFWHSMSPLGVKSAQELKTKIVEQASQWYDQAKAESDQQKSGKFVGQILHMVQDSWSPAHVERDPKGKILGFQAYDKQDPDKHTEAETPKGVDEESWKSVEKGVPGASQAMEVSASILQAFLTNNKEEFMRVLEQNYQLDPDAYVNASSKKLEKAQPKPLPKK